MSRTEPLKVVIAGGGVAGLEAALALRALAGARVRTTLLTPRPDAFIHRALSVRALFSEAGGRRYDLARLARDAAATLCADRMLGIDPVTRVALTAAGAELPYDALLIAVGVDLRPRFDHARTIDDALLEQSLRGLVQDVEDGYVRSLAFIAADPPAWPLPLYELALMTAGAAHGMGGDASITLVTPESAPLAAFGPPASRAVQALLERRGVHLITGAACAVPEPGRVALGRERPDLEVDSVVAMPVLSPRRLAGIPTDAAGFIPVDDFGRVTQLPGVYAAGDATRFSIKQGSMAAQQADAAAADIARQAGADVPAQPLREPVLCGMLLGGDRLLYLRARLRDGSAIASECSEEPLWHPPGKLAARYLGPYLHRADLLSGRLADAVHE